MLRTRHVSFALAIVLMASTVQAGHYCQHCGCQRNCKKVCRLECGKKKETKIEYASECEDFCVPGPSKKCGVKVECDCKGRHRTIIWQPTCAKVYTRKTLVKKEVTKEVPSYKWVVEEYCCVCGQLIKVASQEKPASDKKAERLPITIAAREDTAEAGDDAARDYSDYFVGAETERNEPVSIPTFLETEAELGEAALDEQPLDDAPREPRRLFSGLFGR